MLLEGNSQAKENEHEQRLEEAIEKAAQTLPIGQEGIEWFKEYCKALANLMRTVRDIPEWGKVWKADASKETKEYDESELKWIRWRQTRDKEYDEIVKRKDELARLFKEGEVDLDLVIKSAAEGDIYAVLIVMDIYRFGFRPIKPTLWERVFHFLTGR